MRRGSSRAVAVRQCTHSKTIGALKQWCENYDSALPTASIAADLPIKFFDDTSSLDNRNRGSVLTAMGHLLPHGGGVAFSPATSWT